MSLKKILLKEEEEQHKDLQEQLKEKLLSIGGKSVNERNLNLEWEKDLKRMLNDGKVFDNQDVVYVRGTPNQCHRNVTDQYYKFSKRGFKIISGYALKDDEWVSHSWGFNKSTNRVTETTKIKFDIYYGYELTADESDDFCFENE